MASYVNSNKLYEDYMNLTELYDVPAITQGSANTTMQKNLQWLEKRSGKIKYFLNKQKNSSEKLITVWPLIIGALLIKLFA